MGGDKTLKEAKEWTKEWAIDPETYVRNMGARVGTPTTQLYEMPKTRELQGIIAKRLGIKQPPSVLEFQKEEVRKMIKEGIIKEDVIGKDVGAYEYWGPTISPVSKVDDLQFADVENLKLIYPGISDRLSDAAYASKYAKETEMISKGMQHELMQYTIGGKTGKETDLFVQMARDPKTTAKDMTDLGFEKEYKEYLKYKKDIEERMGKIKQGRFKHITEGVEAPDLPHEEGPMALQERMKLAREPQYGFGHLGPGSGGYYRGQTIIEKPGQKVGQTRKPGVYREKVVVHAGLLNQDELSAVAVHEFQHYLTKGSEGIPRVVKSELLALLKGGGDFDELIDFWIKNDLKVAKGGKLELRASQASLDDIASTIQYYKSSTEIQARMQEIRKALKVSPGKKITSNQVDELLLSSDNYTKMAVRDLLNIMKDKKSLLKGLNTLPALVPAALEENLFNEWDREDNIF